MIHKFKRIIGIMLCFILVMSNFVYALQRPTAQQIEQYKKDGTFTERLERAKNLGNHKTSEYLAWKTQQKVEKMVLKAKGLSDAEIEAQTTLNTPPPAWIGLPTTGTPKVLAILIDFPDYPHNEANQSVSDFTTKFTGAGDPLLYPYDSLTKFYERSSYNQLSIQSGILGWYTAKNPRNYYEKLGDGVGQDVLIMEAINYYDSQGVDFSQYGNGDSEIDTLYIKWTGPNTGWSGFWWAYQWQFFASFTVDGMHLSKYVWSWYGAETYTSTNWQGEYEPRVDIHETGHALGLPDYYDYDPARGPDGGVGDLDMMDANWGDHNAFSKFLLGWISPTIVASGITTKTFNPSGSSQDAALIMPNATGNLFNQYFIAQYRKRGVGNDPLNYPTDGMLIWHVDATLNSSNTDFVYDNSYTSHKLLALEQADGLGEIEKSAQADAEDFYTPSKAFGPTTNPNSNNYANALTNVLIDSFTAPGSTMFASLQIISILVGSADLKVTSVDGPASGAIGSKITITDSIKNEGTTGATGFYVKYYLSKDSLITAKDTYLGQRYVGSLTEGEFTNGATAVTIPKSVKAGTYYVGAIADATKVVTESNENNNTGFDASTISVTR